MKDLSERAMLVRLEISQWTARKHDKRATETVETHYGAHNAGRFNKVLIAEEAIKAVAKTANAARTFHYENTLPWTDEGYRILPAKNFTSYSAKMRELHADFDKSVEELAANYNVLVEDARQRLNGLFNPADYPRDIRSRFGFGTSITPIPTADDFRVPLNSEVLQEIQQELEARLQQATQEAHQDLYRRLATVIGHVADRLGDKEAIFRDSLIDNVRELCELLPRLDIVGDPDLQRIRAEAERKLLKHSPQELRESPAARRQTAKDASAILNALEGFYNGN